MSQSKMASFIEAWANILIGYTVSFIANLIVLPLFGYKVTVGDAFWMSVVFTVLSLVRSYYVRRWFNWLHVRGNEPIPMPKPKPPFEAHP